MIDKMLTFIAPHHCCGCGLVGNILCDGCKYDIADDEFRTCINCAGGVFVKNGICHTCKVPYGEAWVVADRRDSLRRLIDVYKFNNARSAYIPLADLLDVRLPVLPLQTVIVPIPTVRSHIRQRGYDHMLLVARRLARKRNIVMSTCLKRISNTTQRGANARDRILQAQSAFACHEILNPTMTYVLVDDVVTSGATLAAAAKVLRQAGATDIRVASISRQPLD